MKEKEKMTDLALVGLLLTCALFSYCVNGTGSQKSLNHTIAYLASFVIFYITIRASLFTLNNRARLIEKLFFIITFVSVFNGLFVCFEFFMKNFTSIDPDNYIPRAKVEEQLYNPLILGLFYRARGFATESGHFMFMMELLAPIAIYYLNFSLKTKSIRFLRYILTSIILIGMLLSGSIAGYLIIPAALTSTLILRYRNSIEEIIKNKKKILIALLVMTFLIIAINKIIPIKEIIELSISEKIDSESADNRKERTDYFFKEYRNLPLTKILIGAGPAGTQLMGNGSGGSILSLYLSVCFELGIIGLVILIVFIGNFLVNALKIKGKIGFVLTFSMISGILHYNAISNYWYPWFWFIGALILFYKKFEQDNESRCTYSSHV
jgi:hypothetical protein